MERMQVLEMMGELKLFGMRSAYDEVMGVAIKRQHEPPKIVGDLLQAEISEKQARSIRYQLTIAKLPLAKDIQDFDFAGTPANESLIRDLAGGAFVADQRNVVLVAEQAPANLISLLRLPALLSATARADASLMSSTSSTGWTPKRAQVGKDASLIT